MSRRRVSSWPTYLLTGVPEKTHSRLSQDATQNFSGVAETVRWILCAHYDLNCQPVQYQTNPRAIRPRSTPLLLRLQPKLMRALRDASQETGLPVRALILDALEQHYAAVA